VPAFSGPIYFIAAAAATAIEITIPAQKILKLKNPRFYATIITFTSRITTMLAAFLKFFLPRAGEWRKLVLIKMVQRIVSCKC
jgi:hypothetical protein